MGNHKKIYTIKITEPWDFESPDGKNIIQGTIFLVNSYLIVYKANYLLNFDGLSGDILILSPRFGGDFENIATTEVEVNGGLILDNHRKNYDESKLKKNSMFVLIGTLNN